LFTTVGDQDTTTITGKEEFVGLLYCATEHVLTLHKRLYGYDFVVRAIIFFDFVLVMNMESIRNDFKRNMVFQRIVNTIGQAFIAFAVGIVTID